MHRYIRIPTQDYKININLSCNDHHTELHSLYRPPLSVCDTYPNFLKIFSVLEGATLMRVRHLTEYFLKFCEFSRFTSKIDDIIWCYAMNTLKTSRLYRIQCQSLGIGTLEAISNQIFLYLSNVSHGYWCYWPDYRSLRHLFESDT